MPLRTKGTGKKTFSHTSQALAWLENTLKGDQENAQELARVRLILTRIKPLDTAKSNVVLKFDPDGFLDHAEVRDSQTGELIGEY